MATQNNIFKPKLNFSQKTSVSNVNVSNDTFSFSWHPVYVLKFDSTVASTGTTQIVHRFAKQSYKVCIAHCCSHIARQSILNRE